MILLPAETSHTTSSLPPTQITETNSPQSFHVEGLTVDTLYGCFFVVSLLLSYTPGSKVDTIDKEIPRN